MEQATPKNSAISGVMYPQAQEAHEVSLLGFGELWLLAAESALGLGDGHALACRRG